MIAKTIAPLLMYGVCALGIYKLWDYTIDEIDNKFQKPYDIREFHKNGLPLVGTLRQRRLAREADEEEKLFGPERRKALAQEQEWKRISELR